MTTINLRDSLVQRIRGLNRPGVSRVADFAASKTKTGAIPCWGAIAENLSKSQLADSDVEKLWDSMVLAGDSRPLLVLLNEYKGRASLVQHAQQDFGKVPAVVRQAIQAVSNPENVEAVSGFERRMKEILAIRYFVPESPTSVNTDPGTIAK
jgi:hypothetical protein